VHKPLKQPRQPIVAGPGQRVIFRPWREVNGVRLWARDYGLRAWPIVVDD
jgi:hypothetical protein